MKTASLAFGIYFEGFICPKALQQCRRDVVDGREDEDRLVEHKSATDEDNAGGIAGGYTERHLHIFVYTAAKCNISTRYVGNSDYPTTV